jgi:hypothetical protein
MLIFLPLRNAQIQYKCETMGLDGNTSFQGKNGSVLWYLFAVKIENFGN